MQTYLEQTKVFVFDKEAMKEAGWFRRRCLNQPDAVTLETWFVSLEPYSTPIMHDGNTKARVPVLRTTIRSDNKTPVP